MCFGDDMNINSLIGLIGVSTGFITAIVNLRNHLETKSKIEIVNKSLILFKIKEDFDVTQLDLKKLEEENIDLLGLRLELVLANRNNQPGSILKPKLFVYSKVDIKTISIKPKSLYYAGEQTIDMRYVGLISREKYIERDRHLKILGNDFLTEMIDYEITEPKDILWFLTNMKDLSFAIEIQDSKGKSKVIQIKDSEINT